MALAMENDELMKIYNKQTDAWKVVNKDQNYNKQYQPS